MINGIISHSRIDPVFGKTSEVWTRIVEGAVDALPEIEVFAPTKNYNHFPEFLSKVQEAMAICDNIIMPFSKGDDDLVEMINSFEGKICFVNTPPSTGWKIKLNKIIPYIGLHERQAGVKAAVSLGDDIEKIIIIRHEKQHEGHDIRVGGIKAAATCFTIEEVYINPETLEIVSGKIESDAGFITLGVRGTEFAIKNNLSPVVGIDCNHTVRKAWDDGLVKAIILQEPFMQGYLAAKALSSGEDNNYLMEPKVYIK